MSKAVDPEECKEVLCKLIIPNRLHTRLEVVSAAFCEPAARYIEVLPLRRRRFERLALIRPRYRGLGDRLRTPRQRRRLEYAPEIRAIIAASFRLALMSGMGQSRHFERGVTLTASPQ